MTFCATDRIVEEHHISVPRSARYHSLGNARNAKTIWIVLHGYGQLARYFLRNFEGLQDNSLIVAPEALSRFYLDDAHSRVGATWMTREDRENEILDQITHLDALTAHVAGHCASNVPISALGFSQGVATLCRWSVLGKTRIERLVLWGGSMPTDLAAPDLKIKWANTKVDLVHGDQDPLMNELSLARNEAQLRDAQVPCSIHKFGGGHALDNLLLRRIITA